MIVVLLSGAWQANLVDMIVLFRPCSGSDETLDSDDSQLSIVILGSEGLAQSLETEIQVLLIDGDDDVLGR